MRLRARHPTAAQPHTHLSTQETTELVEDVPPGWWQRVADKVRFTPEQEARMGVALDMFFSNMGRHMLRRRELREELESAMQLPSGQLGERAAELEESSLAGVTAAAVRREELLRELQANLVRWRWLAGGGLGAWVSRWCAVRVALKLVSSKRASPPTHPVTTHTRPTTLTNRPPQVSENRMWSTMSWTLRLMLDPRAFAEVLIYSW